MTYQDKLDHVMHLVANGSSRIKMVTTDATEIKPSNTGVYALILSPDVEWDTWDEPEFKYTLWLIAGRAWTQDKAARELLETIEELTHNHLNMQYANAATFQVENMGDLSGYEIKLNPLDL